MHFGGGKHWTSDAWNPCGARDSWCDAGLGLNYRYDDGSAYETLRFDTAPRRPLRYPATCRRISHSKSAPQLTISAIAAPHRGDSWPLYCTFPSTLRGAAQRLLMDGEGLDKMSKSNGNWTSEGVNCVILAVNIKL
jgi:hypothetical protein